MKMVKSLLLGSAAGLVAVTGAQAADLPVKAKAVEYVKVCTLYGAGFYYIPGTDTCIKIGGFFRTEWNHNAGGSFAPYTAGSNGLFTRGVNTLVNRTRMLATFDVRSQTEYGTLRGYVRAGWQWTTGDFQWGGSQCASSLTANQGPAVSSSTVPAGLNASSSCTYLDRAFIQFAGFTFGKTQSYYDFFNTGAYSLQTALLWADNGGAGTPVFAYTAQFGNGLSATISAEDYSERRGPIVALPAFPTTATTNLFAPGGSLPGNMSRGTIMPDIVGNIRVDQAWGSAQVSGVLHDNAALYYNGTNQFGHPGDKWGYAVSGGITLKMPWDAKDTFSGQVQWCNGAVLYCVSQAGGFIGTGAMFGLVNTNTIGVGWVADAFYNGTAASGGGLELTRAWSAVGAFEHYWTPTLRTSIWGAYAKYEGKSASIDALVCAAGPSAGASQAAIGGTFGPGCTDWSAWQIGTRTIWNPVANLDIGVEVMYTKVNSAFTNALTGPGGFSTTSQGLPNALTFGDTHVWSGILRIQRNFWP